MSGMSDKLLVHQRIGFVGLSVMLVTINVFAALSMDMFSPSIPTITEEFGAPETAVTMTISVFFLFYSVGMLIFGSTSDRFGRKPMLVACLVLYIAGSFLCAASANLPMLICCRVVQALGGGGAAAVGTAMLNDVFTPEPREKFLMFMAVFQVIGPVIAPIIGAYIATYSTWHMVFIVLGIIGAVSLVLALLYNETLPEEKRTGGSVLASYKRMGTLLEDKSFTVFMLATVMPGVAFGSILAVGSYIYIDIFGQTETAYGYFFAVIAIIGLVGPSLYGKIATRFSRRRIIEVLMFLPFIGCALILLFGHSNPFAFTACFVPVIIANATTRPAMTSILLLQCESDSGSASGLISFTNTIAGAVGMSIASLFSSDFIIGVAVAAGIAATASAVLWAVFCKQKMQLKGL